VTRVFDRLALRALAPLDRARASWLGLVGRHLRALLRVRSQRVAWQAALLTCSSLALALCVPLWLLTWGPLILGVPHLVSDVRYLVVRQQLTQRRLLCACMGACLVGASAAPGEGYGIAAVASAGLLASGSPARRALAAVGCAGVWLATRQLGAKADVLFAHAHNLVALALWVLWARGDRTQLLPAFVVCCLGCALVLGGAADSLLFGTHALHSGPFAIDAGRWVAELAPVEDPMLALRWTICFAFMQSVHYGVWLRSLPDEDRARPGIRSFAGSYRALTLDVGPWLIALALLVTIGLWLIASSDPVAARSGYLRLAGFHGPLELALITLLWVERRLPMRAG
jgi:hypothetical protein